MGIMLHRKVGWAKWAASKTKEHHLFKSSLLDSFSDVLTGDDTAELLSESEVKKMIDLVGKLEQAPASLNSIFQAEVYQTLLQAEATHLAELVHLLPPCHCWVLLLL